MESFEIGKVATRIIFIVIVTIFLYSIILFLGKYPFQLLLNSIPIILISSVCTLIAFVLKGIRFYIIVKRVLPEIRISFLHSIWIRMASEVFSFIGVSYVGDEAFRIYFLNKMGVSGWRSLWSDYLELFEEVIVAAFIIITGSIYFFIRNIYPLAIIIGLIVSVATTIVNIIFFFGGERIISCLDRIIGGVLKRLSSSIYGKFRDKLYSGIEEGYRVREIIVNDPILITITMAISFLIAFFSGLSLYIIMSFMGVNQNLMFSIFVVYLTLAVSSLPITIGGLGVSEAYLLYLGSEFTSDIPWLLPIIYRLSNYFIPFSISLILLLALLRREID